VIVLSPRRARRKREGGGFNAEGQRKTEKQRRGVLKKNASSLSLCPPQLLCVEGFLFLSFVKGREKTDVSAQRDRGRQRSREEVF